MKRRRSWQEAFIEAMRLMGNVMRSCSFAKVSRRNVYDEYDRNPEFAKAWREAEEESSDRLEAEAWRRAHDGIDKPVFHQGEQCGVIREYSDGLITLLLKARRPYKFRENSSIQIGNPDGSNLEIDMRQQAVNLFSTNERAAQLMIELANLSVPVEGIMAGSGAIGLDAAGSGMASQDSSRRDSASQVKVNTNSGDSEMAAHQTDPQQTATPQTASDTVEHQPVQASAGQQTGALPDCQGSPIEPQEPRQKRKYTRKAIKQPKTKKTRPQTTNGSGKAAQAAQAQTTTLGIVDNPAPVVEDLEIPDAPATTPDVEATPTESTPEPETAVEEMSPLMKQMLGIK